MGLVLVGAALLLRWTALIDRYFIFFPESELIGSPGDVGLEFEDVTFAVADGTWIHGWFVPGDGDVTWLWFHGNAGNVSHRLNEIALVHEKVGVNVFIFDYRGYGRSDGRVSEQGTYEDGVAALKYLESRPDVDPAKIVFFGRSLGAGVAVETAVRHRPYGLVIESGFTSVRSMARRHYPFLPLGFLVRTKYDSVSKIPKVDAPVLVIHGDSDSIVSFEEGLKLFKEAREPKEFYTIEGADHNDTCLVGGDPYFERLRSFVQDLGARPGE